MATFNQAPVTIAVFMERYISKIEEALKDGYQPWRSKDYGVNRFTKY